MVKNRLPKTGPSISDLHLEMLSTAHRLQAAIEAKKEADAEYREAISAHAIAQIEFEERAEEIREGA